MSSWQLENIATMVVTGCTMVGLYFAGAGGYSFLAFLFLLNINYLKGGEA